jgi:putative tricarboxylic transport membrane protein
VGQADHRAEDQDRRLSHGLRTATTPCQPARVAPFVLIVLLIGTYSYQNYTAHVVIALLFGAIAVWLEKIGISVIPIVLAFVMGPIVEKNLLRGLAINGGDFIQLLSRPITLTILLLSALTVLLSLRRRKQEIKEA